VIKLNSRFLENLDNEVKLSFSIPIVLMLGFFDYLVGPEISTSIFYFIPVILVSYREERTSGIIIALVSALVWLISDYMSGHEHSSFVIALWNSIMRLAIFLLIATMFHNLWLRSSHFQRLANFDELTSILNRRGFLARVQDELMRARRFNRSFSIAFIDLDNFKTVNDSLGHKVGDELLRQVALTIQTSIRAVDFVGRLGGDEFAILYVETSQDQAKEAFEKCHHELNQRMADYSWPVTFSVGVVTFHSFKLTIVELLDHADKWMYEVKRQGKNRAIYKMDSDLI